MSLQVRFPFGRGAGPLHTCRTCGFGTRHRALFERHMRRCQVAPQAALGASGGATAKAAAAVAAARDVKLPLPSPPVCRNYKCEKCGYTTSKSKGYLVHRRVEHGENINIYPCDHCEYASRHKSKVIRHRSLVHKDADEVADFPREMDDEELLVATESETSGYVFTSPRQRAPLGNIAVQQEARKPHVTLVQDENQNVSFEFEDGDPMDVGVAYNNNNASFGSVGRPLSPPGGGGGGGGSPLPKSEWDAKGAEGDVAEPDGDFIPDPTEDAYNYIILLTDLEGVTSYRCKLCMYASPHKWKIAGHVRSSHMKKTLFKCPFCEFITERKIEWCVHKTTHTSKVVYACDQCSYRTTMKRNYERHLAHHQMKAPFRCTRCTYSSTGEAAVQRHMAEYHPSPDKELAINSIHTEAAAGARTSGGAAPKALRHLGSLIEVAGPAAAAAGREVTRTPPTAVAVVASPPVADRGESPSSPSGGQDLPCTVCGVIFKSECKLRIHMISHSTQSPWVCPMCPLRYKRPADLNRHMKRKHGVKLSEYQEGVVQPPTPPEQEQPLDLCIKKSGDEAPEDDDDNQDDQDDSSSDSAASNADPDLPLDLSMKAGGGGGGGGKQRASGAQQSSAAFKQQDMKCTYCSYLAKWPSDLRRHMLVHSVEKRYRCSLCNKKYKYQFDLNMHLRKAHHLQTGKTRVSSAAAFAAQQKASREAAAAAAQKAAAHKTTAQLAAAQTAAAQKAAAQKTAAQLAASQIAAAQKAAAQAAATRAIVLTSPRSDVTQHGAGGGGGGSSQIRQLKRAQPKESQKLIAEYYTPEGVPDRLKCPYCPYVGKYRAEVERHTRLHTNAKPYQCLFCSYRTFWKGDMKRHITKHHEAQIPDYGGDLAKMVDLTYQPQEDDGEGTAGEGGAAPDRAGEGGTVAARGDMASSQSGRGEREVADQGRRGDNGGGGGLPSLVRVKQERDDSADDSGGVESAQSAAKAVGAAAAVAAASTPVDKKICRCPHCAYICESPTQLNSHMAVHEDLKRFMCIHCGRRSYWQWDVRKHIRQEHPGKALEVRELSAEDARNTPEGSLEIRSQPQKQQPAAAAATAGSPGDQGDDSSAEDNPFRDYARLLDPECLGTDDFQESWSHLIRDQKPRRAADPGVEYEPQRPTATSLDVLNSTSGLSMVPRASMSVASPAVNSLVATVAGGRFRRFKCSKCGRRSNWKWDVKKHIRATHVSANVIEMSEEEARETFHEVLRTRGDSPNPPPPPGATPPPRSRSASPPPTSRGLTPCSPGSGSPTPDPGSLSSTVGRFRPFKCSQCGKRSNWKWDLNKHIRSVHPRAECVTLTEEEAQATYEEQVAQPAAKLHQTVAPTPSAAAAAAATHSPNGPRPSPESASPSTKLKRYKCSVCPYRSDFRSDISRHLKRRHRRSAGEVQVMDLSEAAASLPEYKRMWGMRKKFVLSPEKERELRQSAAAAAAGVKRRLSADTEPCTSTGSPAVDVDVDAASKKAKLTETMWRCSRCSFKNSNRMVVIKHFQVHAKGSAFLYKISEDGTRVEDEGAGVSTSAGGGQTSGKLATGGVQEPCSRKRVELGSFDNVTGELETSGEDGVEQEAYVIKLFQCQNCSSATIHKHNMVRHIKDKHPEIADPKAAFDEVDRLSKTAPPSMAKKLALKSKRMSLQEAGASPLLLHHDMAPTKLQCDLCPFQTIKLGLLKIHKRYHKPLPAGQGYKCRFCPFYVCTRRRLEQHMNLHLKTLEAGNPVPGALASAGPSVATTMTTAKLEQTGSPPPTPVRGSGKARYFCDKCPYVSINKNDYIYHKQFHRPKASAPFKCDFCPYWVSLRRLLTQHQKVHTSAYMSQYYPKAILDRTDRSPAVAGLTATATIAASPCKSDISGLSVGSMSDLSHIKQQIIDSKIVSVAITPEKLVPLNGGGGGGEAMGGAAANGVMKGYIVDSGSGQVMSSGAYRKQHQCAYCPYTNVRGSNLRLHQKMHCRSPRKGKELHRCPYCDYSVGNKGLLTHHIKVHSAQYRPGQDEINDIEMPDDCPSSPLPPPASSSPSDDPSGQAPHHLCTGRDQGMELDGVRRADNLGREGDGDDPLEENNNNNEAGAGAAKQLAGEKRVIKTDVADHLDVRQLPEKSQFYIKYDRQSGEHILEKATLKKWCCEKCPYATMKRSQYEKHVVLHGSRQKYMCEFCDYSVPGFHLLLQHKKLHLMPNPNLLSVQSISNLQRLPEIPADIAAAAVSADDDAAAGGSPGGGRVGEGPGGGGVELRKFGTHGELSLYENSADFTEPRKLYRCDRCPYTNVRRDHLLSHLKFHMIHSELTCPYCDYSVTKVHLLNQHIKVHFNSPGGEMNASPAAGADSGQDTGLAPLDMSELALQAQGEADRAKRIRALERHMEAGGGGGQGGAGETRPEEEAEEEMTERETEDGGRGGEERTRAKEGKTLAGERKPEGGDVVEEAMDEGEDAACSQALAEPMAEAAVAGSAAADDVVKGQTRGPPAPTAPITATAAAAKATKDTMWICQYCDRAFDSSPKLLRHEMQHLVGSKF